MSRRTPAGVLAAAGSVAIVAGGCRAAPATDQGLEIAQLTSVFLAAGAIVALVVWGLATAAIVRGRRRAEPAVQTHGDRRVEAAWTAIPLVTVLVLFVLTLRTLASVDAVGTTGVQLHVTAFRWQWAAEYAGTGVRLVGTPDHPLEVVLPVGTPVVVTLDSIDVNHSFYVPDFLFKRDAIPGKPTTFELRVVAPGVYPGACAEFCGVGHDQMPFTIRGVDEAAFRAWLAAAPRAGASASP